jgi:hypothetical protein
VQSLREAFPEAGPYRYIILDRDSKFDAEAITFLKAARVKPKCTSDTDELFRNEAAFPGAASPIAARLAKGRILGIKNLNAVVTAIANVHPAVVGYLRAMHGVPEEGRLYVTPRVIRDPRPRRRGALIVNRIIAISAEMADVLSRLGIHDQDAAVSIAISDVETIRCRIDYHIGGLIEYRCGCP